MAFSIFNRKPSTGNEYANPFGQVGTNLLRTSPLVAAGTALGKGMELFQRKGYMGVGEAAKQSAASAYGAGKEALDATTEKAKQAALLAKYGTEGPPQVPTPTMPTGGTLDYIRSQAQQPTSAPLGPLRTNQQSPAASAPKQEMAVAQPAAASGRAFNMSPDLRATIPSGLEQPQAGILRQRPPIGRLASGDQLASLFPKTYGGAATNPLMARQQQDMINMRQSFDSPRDRAERHAREARTERGGILRSQQAHELDVARAENPVVPPPAKTTVLQQSLQTGKNNKQTQEYSETRNAAGALVHDDGTPFSKEEIQQRETGLALDAAMLAIEAIPEKGLLGGYKGSNKKGEEAAKAGRKAVRDLITTAIPGFNPPPEVLERAFGLLAGGDEPNAILADLRAYHMQSQKRP